MGNIDCYTCRHWNHEPGYHPAASALCGEADYCEYCASDPLPDGYIYWSNYESWCDTCKWNFDEDDDPPCDLPCEDCRKNYFKDYQPDPEMEDE